MPRGAAARWLALTLPKHIPALSRRSAGKLSEKRPRYCTSLFTLLSAVTRICLSDNQPDEGRLLPPSLSPPLLSPRCDISAFEMKRVLVMVCTGPKRESEKATPPHHLLLFLLLFCSALPSSPTLHNRQRRRNNLIIAEGGEGENWIWSLE